MPGERYHVSDGDVEVEATRLAMLSSARDPKTFEVLTRVGVDSGMRCLEIGAGTGSVSAWMAERVGHEGSVVSTDVDLRFHLDMPDNVTVREHDIVADAPLPREAFDVVHARAVLQHLPERERVLGMLVDCLEPGGVLVVEDANMLEFAQQSLPEPYGAIHRMIVGATHEEWREPNCALFVAGWMRDLGLVGLDLVGDVWAMRSGEPAGEWWFLALERALPMLVELGIVESADAETALAQVREPGFVMLSPTSIATFARKPG